MSMPRLTRRVFLDLAVWMVLLGLLIGLLFPTFLTLMGVPAEYAYARHVIVLSVLAGLFVALFNHLLVGWVVGPRLSMLADRMRTVERVFVSEMNGGDKAKGGVQEVPRDCYLPVDSEDEIGEAARSFNSMIDALKRSRAFSGAARSFSHAMASDLDLDSLGERALSLMRTHCGVDAGAIYIEQDGQLRLIFEHAIHNAESLGRSSFLARAMRQEEEVHIHLPMDVEVDALLTRFRPQEILIVPVRYKGRAIGVMLLAGSQPLRADARQLVAMFQQGLGLALNNAIVHSQLQQIAVLDALTGVYNRRFGMKRLREEFSRAQRGESPLGVIMFDIDHFKSINDTYGHMVGDRVLIAISDAARGIQREGDVLVRYGGEEFLLLLPGASCNDCQQIAERLLRAAADSEVAEGRQKIRVTISVGFASYPETAAEREDDLVEQADQALYLAKNRGRNRAEAACTMNGAGNEA